MQVAEGRPKQSGPGAVTYGNCPGVKGVEYDLDYSLAPVCMSRRFVVAQNTRRECAPLHYTGHLNHT
jgi:hypothetical protein